MAEVVIFNIAERIIVRLGNHAFQKIGSIWGVQDELNKLKETVAGFQDVLLDAERKQANNNVVKLWLQSVEDAVYEADDVLDEFNTEVQRRQVMRDNTKLSKVRLLFSSSNQLVFGLKMSHKIKDINKRLSDVASRTPSDLNNNREDTRFILRERVAHSFVPKDNIIGRDEDKKALIQLFLDPISTENVSTISIVGIGGLGKTALAQLIFNDEVIQKHFELKIWVCVSNIFELDILAKKILKADKLAKEERDKVDELDMDQLQNELRKKVDGKKYLLVLDDVWNENPQKWLILMDLLKGGGEGSRILITTRTKTVAMTSHTTKLYTLRGLNEDQSWSLFKEMAFQDGKEPENSTIKAIGMEVARKCQGVPLAIRTIGGTLLTKDQETEWSDFKEKKLSKIRQEENGIFPTLKLSYDVLPSHLKHCFAYCSLFPPDYDISVKRLTRLWVAQGFVKSSDENEGLEDVAYEYYRELLQRSFFQEEKTGEFGMCKMHDLMNELAISVSGDRSAIVDLNPKNFHEKLRHVSFNFDIDLSKWEVPTSLLKENKIRTFLFLQQQGGRGYQSFSGNAFYSTIVSNFKSLRMLSLNELGITTLPNCLRKMKHLRYLDLSNNPMERLPDCIVELPNLETLDLSSCGSLVELHRDIKKMINLRHLIMEGYVKLTGMPRGIGELNGVRTLNRFALGRGAGLGELGSLKELRGWLFIDISRHEKDVVSESNVGTPLKDKQHLHSLTLLWEDREDVTGVDEEDIIKSMEVLQPHSNLKHLSVRCYADGHRSSRLYHPIYRLPFNPTTRLPLSVSEAPLSPRNGTLKIATAAAMSDAIDLSGDGGVLKKIVRRAKPDAIAPTQDLPLVDVHYEGILEETGEVFDTTHEDNTIFSFEIGKGSVIKAWDIAVKTMKVGEIAKITCKPEYAYGSAGSPPDIPPGATLVFEVELVACNPRKGLSLGSASEERARLEELKKQRELVAANKEEEKKKREEAKAAAAARIQAKLDAKKGGGKGKGKAK